MVHIVGVFFYSYTICVVRLFNLYIYIYITKYKNKIDNEERKEKKERYLKKFSMQFSRENYLIQFNLKSNFEIIR